MIKNKKNNDPFAYVRALLVLHRIKQIDIAREAGVTAQQVNNVLYGAMSKRIRAVIAGKLGMTYSELWDNRRKKAA